MTHLFGLLFVAIGLLGSVVLIIKRINLLERLICKYMDITEDKLNKVFEIRPTLYETEHLRRELKSINFKINMLEGMINDKTSVDDGKGSSSLMDWD